MYVEFNGLSNVTLNFGCRGFPVVRFLPSRKSIVQTAFDQPVAKEFTHQVISGPETSTIFHARQAHPILGLIHALSAADG